MLTIRNPETKQLARTLADRKGVTLTKAVTDALQAEVDRLPPEPVASTANALWEKIKTIQNEFAALPRQSDLTLQEIKAEMYDAFGLPQ
jgi:antitoxin VapB